MMQKRPEVSVVVLPAHSPGIMTLIFLPGTKTAHVSQHQQKLVIVVALHRREASRWAAACMGGCTPFLFPGEAPAGTAICGSQALPVQTSPSQVSDSRPHSRVTPLQSLETRCASCDEVVLTWWLFCHMP